MSPSPTSPRAIMISPSTGCGATVVGDRSTCTDCATALIFASAFRGDGLVAPAVVPGETLVAGTDHRGGCRRRHDGLHARRQRDADRGRLIVGKRGRSAAADQILGQ